MKYRMQSERDGLRRVLEQYYTRLQNAMSLIPCPMCLGIEMKFITRLRGKDGKTRYLYRCIKCGFEDEK